MDYRERWELKDYLIGRTLERRISLFHVAVAVLLLAFLLDFWYLQGVKADEYSSLAENNLRRRIPLRPTRGEIYDSRDAVIASSRPSLDLMLRREGSHDLEAQLRRLAPILGEPEDLLLQALQKVRGRPLFEPLLVKSDVSLQELAQIEARRERFPSVEVRQSARRHYPGGDVVPHIIGYVGKVSESELAGQEQAILQRGDIVGKSGIERVYDSLLRGRRGAELVAVNNLGRRIGASRVEREPEHGERLELTLDMELQRTLTEALSGEVGAGVFLDPRNGDVLAIASAPTLDPNLFADGFTHEAWREITEDVRRPLHDRAIASFYAPGSTFKVVLAAAGLETGAIRPEDRVFCNGSATFYGRRRLCWRRGGHGWVDLRHALADSCNVYFYKLGQTLGIETIHDYGKLFGLGEPTGIDVTGEEGGILPSDEWKRRNQGEPWYPGDTISVAIGQGLLAVTPLQMARMIAGVATGGELPRPHLNRNRAGESTSLPISAETFAALRGALELAVMQGTGRAAALRDFSVAGKTGTAQVYRHSAGVDSDELPKAERDHAWFVGYAPAKDPRIAFAVIVEHGGHGGSTAAPIARRVLEVFFGGRTRDGEEGRRAEARPGRTGEELLVRAASAR